MSRTRSQRILAFLSAAAVAGQAALCAAAGLPLETLPANARWVAHLDAKALRAAPLGKEILASLAGTPAEAGLQKFEAQLGTDLRRDLAAVTVSGSGGAEQGGVVYLRGNWNPGRLSAVFAANPECTTAAYGRHALLSWSDPRAEPGFERETVCLVSSNLLLLGNRETAVRQALDVLDGRSASLATAPRFRRLAALDTNAFLHVAAIDLKEIVGDNPQASALPVGDSLRLVLSSEGQGVRLKAVIKATTPEAAQQLRQTLVGLQTVMILQGIKNPDIGQIAQSTRIGVTDTDVSLVLTAPVETLKRLFLQPKHGKAKAARAPAAQTQPPTPVPEAK